MASSVEGSIPGEPDEAGESGGPGELAWSWELDLASLLDAVSGAAPWLRSDPAAESEPHDNREPVPSEGSAATAGNSDAQKPDPEAEDAAYQEADPEEEEAAYQEARAAGRVRDIPLELVAGRIAESLPTGPGLASWLAQARAAELEDGALAGVAASFRRLASWAVAGELAAVAQIASRSARTDRRAPTA